MLEYLRRLSVRTKFLALLVLGYLASIGLITWNTFRVRHYLTPEIIAMHPVLKDIQQGAYLTQAIATIGYLIAGLIMGVAVHRLMTTIQRELVTLRTGASNFYSELNQTISFSTGCQSSGSKQLAVIHSINTNLSQISHVAEDANAKATDSASAGTIAEMTATTGLQAAEMMIGSIENIIVDTGAIENKIHESFKHISEVVSVIAQIEQKTKVIHDIVFQTKLLSFNASVEAARAGENGKGFAVVAEEVGKLAQMSGHAAHDIGSMLNTSLEHTKKVVQETEAAIKALFSGSKEALSGGVELAKQSGEITKELALSIKDITSKIAEISAVIQTQSKSISQVAEAVTALDQLSAENFSHSQGAHALVSQTSTRADDFWTSLGILETHILGATTTNKSLKEQAEFADSKPFMPDTPAV